METNDIKEQLKAMTEGFDQWVDRRKRRRLTAVSAVACLVAAVAVVTILALPTPEGLYMSDTHLRAEVLHSIDLTLQSRL